MSGGTALPVATPAQPHHRLLTFASLWRRSQVMALYGAGVMLVGTAITYAQTHKIDAELLGFGLVLVAFAIGLHFASRRHYLAADEEGLRINRLVGHQLIPFGEIRQVRCQTVEVLFSSPGRRQRMPRALRPFQGTLACSIRVDLSSSEVTRAGRGLGRGCVVDQDLIALVSEPKQLEQALQARIRRRPPAAHHRR